MIWPSHTFISISLALILVEGLFVTMPCRGEKPVRAPNGLVEVSMEVCEFTSSRKLEEIEPWASKIRINQQSNFPSVTIHPVLPGFHHLLLPLSENELGGALRLLEAHHGAKRHSKTHCSLPIGEEAVFRFKLGRETHEARVQSLMDCEENDEVRLLLSVPDAASAVNPILRLSSSCDSDRIVSIYILGRSSRDGDRWHHSLLVMQARHYGIAGDDPVSHLRRSFGEVMLPQVDVTELAPLQFLDVLRVKAHSAGEKFDFVWIPAYEGISYDHAMGMAFSQKRPTLHDALDQFRMLSQLGMSVEPYGVVFRLQSSHSCNPSELFLQEYHVKPALGRRFPDDDAIGTAVALSNIRVFQDVPDAAFVLDRQTWILRCRNLPTECPLIEKWLREQKLLIPRVISPVTKAPALLRAADIILPVVEFRKKPLSEAVDAINEAAMMAAPLTEPVRLVLEPAVNEHDLPVTLYLRDVPLSDVARHLARLGGRRLSSCSSQISLQSLDFMGP